MLPDRSRIDTPWRPRHGVSLNSAHGRYSHARFFNCFPTTTLLALAGVALTALILAPEVEASHAPRVRELIRRASLIGVGRIAATEDFDHGRIRVHDVVLEQELKPGESTSARTVRAVSITDQPGGAVAEAHVVGVAFLQPLRRNSYLDQNLTATQGLYEFVDGRDGWLQASDSSSLDAMRAPIEAIVKQSRAPAAGIAQRGQLVRAVAFGLLSAPHPLLAKDGIDSLSSIANLAGSLTESESGILAAALANSALPVPTRTALIDEIAALDLRQLVGPLQELSEPKLRLAALAALRKLGAPASEKSLRQLLASEEPLVRSAAARELLATEASEAIPLVAGSLLRDANKEVRLDTIEALGETRSPEAVTPLEGVFAGEDIEERQASARALREIGGEVAAEALHRLAFAGSVDSQRYAVIVLLSLGVGTDDRRVRDIAKRHTDEKITEMLEHGLELGHHH